jgi:uncharacterized protein
MARTETGPTSGPLILLVPGLNNSGPDHWQTKWEEERDDCERIDLGMWDKPHRNTWVNKLNHAVHSASRPVILVAHSLGCHAVAWWAAFERPLAGYRVLGALMVAPPDVDRATPSSPLSGFAPTPNVALPFDSIVVASHDDHYMSYDRAKRLATLWGAQFADAGLVGHISANSGIGSWAFGKVLLDTLIRRTSARPSRAIQRRLPELMHSRQSSASNG